MVAVQVARAYVRWGVGFTLENPAVFDVAMSPDGEAAQNKTRQTVNVYRLHRGSLAHLGLDPAKLQEIRQRSREISFSVKYTERR